MIYLLSFCIFSWILSFYLSPFPYWRTYIILWRTLLFDKNKSINSGARIKQAGFLIKYILLCPVWTFLWYLDEIFYSEYNKLEIRPVFIIGEPRSGTTFLHRTLAADTSNFVAIKHIEWRYPFICLHKILSNSGWANKNYWSDSSAGQIASKMHPNKLSDWEEDGIFFEECFLHHLFIFLRFPYPQLLQYLDDFPRLPEAVQSKLLKTHGKVIRKALFLNGGDDKYYLSKEVTSHNKIERILEIYPDAKFIVCVRNSAHFMNSLMSLVKYSTMSKTGIDPMGIPMWETVFMERMKKDSNMLCYLSDYKIKKSNQVRILFDRFTEEVAHSIQYIYKQLNLELCDSYLNYIQSVNNFQKARDRGYDYKENTYEGFAEFDEFVRRTDLEFSHSLLEIEKTKQAAFRNK